MIKGVSEVLGDIYSPLLLIVLALILIHFGFPLTYYYYLKSRWLNKPWGIKRDLSYKPKVSIIIPTYNEVNLIESKLNDLVRQDYPRDLVEVIVVDSASTDGTSEKVREWVRRNPELKLVLIEESVRRGKVYALNNALRYVSGDIVVITDADAIWSSSNTLSNAISWFNDPIVGAVTCLKVPANEGLMSVEEGYREFYNVVRLAESKKYSTPIFHGELAVFRRNLLESIGGFPTDIGADDSYTATKIALMGYRAIAVDNALCVERIPRREYHMWRIRRAQHLIQHFIKALRYVHKAPKEFRYILLIEAYLHLINPWLFPTSLATLLYGVMKGITLTVVLLVLGLLLLLYKPFRTWIATQLYLAIATVRNLWTKEIAWRKQEKGYGLSILISF